MILENHHNSGSTVLLVITEKKKSPPVQYHTEILRGSKTQPYLNQTISFSSPRIQSSVIQSNVSTLLNRVFLQEKAKVYH